MTEKEKNEFKEAVYEIVRMVPRGRATSYGAIARAAGLPSRARIAGRIVGEHSGPAKEFPAHRVVNSQGVLSGYHAFGDGMMQGLLESEGIKVKNNRIVNWEEVFWDPLKEIGL